MRLDPRFQLIRYQFGNHLGSASLELDEEGRIVSYEEYHPYGSTAYQAGRNAAEVSLKRYRYTGTERDEESGLSSHGLRYYAPWLARWVSCDPIGVAGGVNVYAYVTDNPVHYRDLSGLDSQAAGQLSDEEWINLANTDPIYVNGTLDPLGLAVGNGLSVAPTEDQFEWDLASRVSSSRSAYDWTTGPNIDWEYDPEAAQETWKAFSKSQYEKDREVRNAELQKAYRRMDTAANVGKVIGGVTVGFIALGQLAPGYIALGGKGLALSMGKGLLFSTVLAGSTSEGGFSGCGAVAGMGGGALPNATKTSLIAESTGGVLDEAVVANRAAWGGTHRR